MQPTQPQSTALDVTINLVLEDFHLEANFQADAEIIAIFGPSGAGKSTTLRAIAGLLSPQHGIIRLGEKTLFDDRKKINLPPQSRGVGYVPQNFALFPHLTTSANIAYGLHRATKEHRRQRVSELLHLLQLEKLAQRKASELSGGQQQRVALARALAPNPDILLMDEPFAALDETLRHTLRGELRTIPQRFGVPLILVTHNLGEAHSLASQLVILDQGKMLQAGPRKTILHHPITPAVARIVGMNNILKMTIAEQDEGKNVLNWGGIQLAAPPLPRGLQLGREVLVGIRPEGIRLVETRPPNCIPHTNRIEAHLHTDEDLGHEHHLTVLPRAAPDTPLEIRIAAPDFEASGLRVGSRCHLEISPEAMHIFHEHASIAPA